MSIEAIDHVLKHSRATSSPLQAVLLVLANYHDPRTGLAYPGMARIARESKQSARQAQRSIQKLEELGALHVQRQRGKGNRYVLRLEEASPAAIPLLRSNDVDVTSDVDVTGDISGSKVTSPTSSDPLRTVKTFTARSKPRHKAAKATDPADAQSDDMRLLGVYAELFKAAHVDAPQIEYGRDRKMLRELLSQHAPAKIEKALREMFRTRDPWVIKNGHTLTLFRREFNRFLAGSGPAAGEATRLIPDTTAWRRDCRHTPPCRSAFEHEEAERETHRATA